MTRRFRVSDTMTVSLALLVAAGLLWWLVTQEPPRVEPREQPTATPWIVVVTATATAQLAGPPTTRTPRPTPTPLPERDVLPMATSARAATSTPVPTVAPTATPTRKPRNEMRQRG